MAPVGAAYAFRMVLTLLIPAIPTTIGTCEAISVQKQKILEAKLSSKFNLIAHVRDKTAIDPEMLSQLDGSYVVLLNGKVRNQTIKHLRTTSKNWISLQLYLENSIPIPEGYKPLHRFSGYYFNFPLPEPVQGMVSTISDDPPMLNWIYVDQDTMELKFGNKTTSQEHMIGSWGWSGNERELTMDDHAQFVVVEEDTEAWGVYYDKSGDWSDLPIEGRILDVELERCIIAAAPPT